jgi:hypothetical protein
MSDNAHLGGERTHQLEHLGYSEGDRNRLGRDRKPPGLDPGIVENLVDQLEEVPSRLHDLAQGVGLTLTEIVHLQQLAEAEDCIQGGSQLVAHSGEEVALGLVGPFRFGLGPFRLFLQPASLADVPHRRHNQYPGFALEGTEADLDRELRPVLATSEEGKADAHGSDVGIGHERSPVLVGGPEPLRDQQLHRLADQFLSLVTKETNGLGVDQHDPALLVNDDHRIGSRLQEVLEEALGIRQGPFGPGQDGASPAAIRTGV